MPALVLAVLLSGCGTLTSLTTARPAKPGHLSVALEGGAMATRSPGWGGNNEAPIVAATTRLGVSEDFELGLRVGNVRPEMLFKVLLTERNAPVAFALEPTFGVWGYETSAGQSVLVYSTISGLLAIDAGGFSDVIIAPKVEVTMGWQLEDQAWGGAVTAALGLGWFARATEWLAFVPEIVGGVHVVHFGTGGGVAGQGFVLQAALGIVFGGDRGFEL